MTSVIVISYYSISYLLFSYLSITKKRREAEASPPSLYYELQIYTFSRYFSAMASSLASASLCAMASTQQESLS